MPSAREERRQRLRSQLRTLLLKPLVTGQASGVAEARGLGEVAALVRVVDSDSGEELVPGTTISSRLITRSSSSCWTTEKKSGGR